MAAVGTGIEYREGAPALRELREGAPDPNAGLDCSGISAMRLIRVERDRPAAAR